jgi:spore coat protein CotF
MMKRKVKSILVKKLRNNLHFEFMSSILALLQTMGAAVSLIAGVLNKFAALVKEEDDSLDQLKRYETTQEIHEEDGRRDNAFYQVYNLIRSDIRHFNEAKRDAAERISNIMREFKGVPKLPLAEESAAIHNLLQKFETVSNDINFLGLNEWVDEMRDANEKVRTLMASRESEAANKAQHRVKVARAAVDEAYSEILTCLEAAAIVENPDNSALLIAEINARIDEYNNVLAREKGWRNSKKEANDE